MKFFKQNGVTGGMVTSMLFAVVLGLFSLTGCASTPDMPNAVDIVPGSAEDPFAGTVWEGQAGQVYKFRNDGTLWGVDVKYTVVSGDDGFAATWEEGGLFTPVTHTLTIETSDATEGIILQKAPGLTLTIPVTRQ